VIYQEKTKILSNRKIKDNFYRCIFSAPRIAKHALPGQFVNVKVSDTCQPLLRRPFSIFRVRGTGYPPLKRWRAVRVQVEILYAVVGEASRVLSQKKPGEYLDVIGPLGNGFDYRTPNPEPRTPVLVAGGMGVAPLVFLAEKLRKSTVPSFAKASEGRHSPQSTVLIGAKTKSQILCEKEFKGLNCEVKIATDDGSRGFKGKVSGLLKHLLLTMDYRLWTIYTCGPRPMLQQVSRISVDYNVPAQISLEEHMACGIGACLGCAVNTVDGYKRVCKEGPVFMADEIIWE